MFKITQTRVAIASVLLAVIVFTVRHYAHADERYTCTTYGDATRCTNGDVSRDYGDVTRTTHSDGTVTACRVYGDRQICETH